MKCNGHYEYDGHTYSCNLECGCGWVGCPVGGSGLEGAVRDVADFHQVMGQPIHTTLETPDDERVRLRARLIAEECRETLNGMLELPKGLPYDELEVDSRDVKVDHVAIADGLADLIYVCIGAALEFGIDLSAVWSEVQSSNMRKVGPNGEVLRRPDGKVIKPLDWTGPDIKKALGIK